MKSEAKEPKKKAHTEQMEKSRNRQQKQTDYMQQCKLLNWKWSSFRSATTPRELNNLYGVWNEHSKQKGGDRQRKRERERGGGGREKNGNFSITFIFDVYIFQ